MQERINTIDVIFESTQVMMKDLKNALKLKEYAKEYPCRIYREMIREEIFYVFSRTEFSKKIIIKISHSNIVDFISEEEFNEVLEDTEEVVDEKYKPFFIEDVDKEIETLIEMIEENIARYKNNEE